MHEENRPDIEDILRWNNVSALDQIDNNALIYEYMICPHCYGHLEYTKERTGMYGDMPYYENILHCPFCEMV